MKKYDNTEKKYAYGDEVEITHGFYKNQAAEIIAVRGNEYRVKLYNGDLKIWIPENYLTQEEKLPTGLKHFGFSVLGFILGGLVYAVLFCGC